MGGGGRLTASGLGKGLGSAAGTHGGARANVGEAGVHNFLRRIPVQDEEVSPINRCHHVVSPPTADDGVNDAVLQLRCGDEVDEVLDDADGLVVCN